MDGTGTGMEEGIGTGIGEGVGDGVEEFSKGFVPVMAPTSAVPTTKHIALNPTKNSWPFCFPVPSATQEQNWKIIASPRNAIAAIAVLWMLSDVSLLFNTVIQETSNVPPTTVFATSFTPFFAFTLASVIRKKNKNIFPAKIIFTWIFSVISRIKKVKRTILKRKKIKDKKYFSSKKIFEIQNMM
jgi:hypothetical protein